MPTVGSLFSGVGGFDLGFEREGFDVAYQVEFDKHAQSVLRRHWPNTPLFEDVRNVGAANLPAVDALVGGFPCQDLSVAGRRAGLAGERSGLFYEFARIIEESNPEWVVIENVAGLLSSRGGRDMGAVLGTLSELGYGWAYRVLDSQYFGVAQRRRRVFIVGRSGGRSRSCAEVLFERESVLGNPPPSRAPGQSTACRTGGCSEGGGGRITFAIQDCREIEKHQNGLGATESNVSYTLDGTGAQGVAECSEEQPCEHTIELERLWAENDARLAGVVGALDSECGASKLTDQTIRNGHVMPVAYWDGGDISDTLDVSVLVKRQTMPDKRRMAAVVGRSRVRRLTSRECERLQGFPDDWTTEQADTHRYKQMGNAVTVPVAQWIASRILREIQSESSR
jgi:DNA (cytosine-5)-methyltransferase 1